MTERRLLRHLTLAVLLKLVVLGVLGVWLHAARVTVDGDTAARHLLAVPTTAASR